MDSIKNCLLLFMIIAPDVYSLTFSVYQSAEKAVLGDNPFTLSCTYTMGSLDMLYSIELMRKRESDSDFTTIITFQNPSSPLNVTYQDTSLESRTVATKPTAESKTATLIFNRIECDDKATYKWKAFYSDGTNKNVEQISVFTVKAKTLFGQQEHRSLSYVPSINLEEGDNVVFTCSGDVGNEPLGYLGWFYYLYNDTADAINASSKAISTAPVYQSSTCSYTRTSTLQLRMTRNLNNLIVRCTVQQDKYDQFGDGHLQTENIPVFYVPSVSAINNISIEVGQSVSRMCSGDSYPLPFYTWQLPNGSEIHGQSLKIRAATTEDTGLYTCIVYNTFKGFNHTVSETTFIYVLRATTSTPTTSLVSATTNLNVQTDVYSLTLNVSQSADKAVLGDNPFTLSCTYTKGSLEQLYSIELMRKRESESYFTIIVIFPNPLSPLNATYTDSSLESRTVATKPTESSKTATLVFNKVECDDKATYKWKAFYSDGTIKDVEKTSTFTVKAKALFWQQYHRSLSYIPSTNIEEGNTVLFTCSGDVGNEPVGHLGWFYYLYNNTPNAINASSKATSTTPVYQSSTCSYTRTSSLQLTMTRNLNNLIVRCTVQQDRYDQFGDGHLQTENIPVFYAPSVSAIDDITVMEGQYVSRMCSGDSNPSPFYTWQLPNGSEIAGPSLIIRTATIKDTGFYTCIVYNTYKGANHTVSETTFLYVLRATTSTPTTSLVSATTNLNVQTDYSVKEAVHVACTGYHWFITVDMDKIRNIYPKAKAADIYLGENKCRGLEKGYHLIFQHGLFECLTSEMLGDGMKVYNNELIYAEHDPVYLFIVFSYNWTVGVECDVRQNGTAIGGFPTSVTNSTSQSLGSRQYPVGVSFYKDQDFIREIGKGNPLHVKIGSQVYVKVFTTATDWNIRMRADTCYTKPTEHAHDHMKYFLIKDGCEVNTNTHIISQSAHATRFVFQSFEYSNSHEGIYVFCDAIFCNSSDWSARCRQTCNPVL